MAFTLRTVNPRMISMIQLGAFVPQEGMGSLIGDVFSSINQAVIKPAIDKAKDQLMTTAQQEAAALASKKATEALQRLNADKKKKPGIMPPPSLPPGTPTVGPTAEGREVTVPAQIPQTSAMTQYAPYAIALVGGTVLVLLLARRGK